jgi:hypothetical protein
MVLDQNEDVLVVFLRYRGFGYAERNIGDANTAKEDQLYT